MSLMEWVFGKQITPQERLKMNQRSLQRAMRELDREKRKLEQQETKLVSEIRKMCKNGQIKQAKIKSKDLIRTKNEMMYQKQDMMDYGLDDVFEEEDDEEEADEFLNQIMDEIGVDLKNKLNTNTPEENLEQNTLQEAQNEDSNRVAIGADNDLQARLDSLKR